MHFSRVFVAGHRRKIGLYVLLSLTLFPGFRSRMIVDCFHIDGKVLDKRQIKDMG